MSRRNIQVFNMSFLDMITNFTGACILLLLLAMREVRETPCPEIGARVEAHLDPVSGAIWSEPVQSLTRPLAAGDTILVILTDNRELYQNSGTAVCTRKHCDAIGAPPAPPAPTPPPAGETAIRATCSTSDCDNRNTPDPLDDQYLVTVSVNKYGNLAGNMWKEQTSQRTGTYNSPGALGPFKVSQGKIRLTFSDLQQPGVKTELEINPPKCAEMAVEAPAYAADGARTRLPGFINFHLDWDDENDRVNLYVEKDGNWVYGGVPKHPDIGTFKQAREPGLMGKILNAEEVFQLKKAIPGTYRIYAHYKRRVQPGTAKPGVRVRFTAYSKNTADTDKQVETDVPLTEGSPRRGGGKLLATIEVMADGTIRTR